MRITKMETLISVKETAKLLNCSEAAIRKWIFQRRLPIVKLGRLTRLRVSDIETMVAEGSRAPLSGSN
jgi:excisionase family DNA binding protein